jgi:hypothetical protein
MNLVANLPSKIADTATNVCVANINKIPTYTETGGFAHEQTLRDATLAVFSFANFKTASA